MYGDYMDIEEQWKKCLIPESATIKDAISNLDETGFQIVLVVSSQRILLGAVTDGDVRRGLLRGFSLNTSIESIINRDPLVVPPEIPHDAISWLFKTNKVTQIPIVNAEREVVGLHLMNKLAEKNNSDHPMIIMAGGLGTRLKPRTEYCPKPLLPVGGKPILEHIIERARNAGFTRFLLAIRYLGHMIEDYFGDGRLWDVEIDYLREDIPLGTAGALSLMAQRPEKAFLVSNGDILTDICYDELLDFHLRHKAAATMAIRSYQWQHPFGVVQTKGVDIIDIEEKPLVSTHVNAGVYVLEPHVLDLLNKTETCDMTVLFERIRQRGLRTVAYPIHESWLDVGCIESFEEANKMLEYV